MLTEIAVNCNFETTQAVIDAVIIIAISTPVADARFFINFTLDSPP